MGRDCNGTFIPCLAGGCRRIRIVSFECFGRGLISCYGAGKVSRILFVGNMVDTGARIRLSDVDKLFG